MEYILNTSLKGNIALSSTFHANKELQQNKSLYKFLWITEGSLTLLVDHIPVVLRKNDIIALTPHHYVEIKQVDGDYLTLLFNSNFYCIFGHDNEVSCNGILFNGSSNFMILHLSDEEAGNIENIVSVFKSECTINDSLQEEMLRIILKRFIITCTRIGRYRFQVTHEKEKSFDLVRQFYVLVDKHFKEKKKVSDYAALLNRSPKTITNLFASYDIPTPLQIIHDRIISEARRLLIYTDKSAKEIAALLGFDDQATFSRFFKKNTGKSITEFRSNEN